MKASHYWQFVRLKATGLCIRETIANAREFFLQQFPVTDALDAVADLTDLQVQRQLWQLSKNGESQAEICLRCFISNQIEQTCYQIANQFGTDRGFRHKDLLVFVLNDVLEIPRNRQPIQNTFISVARDILNSFEPERSNLATWTSRKVKQNRELHGFLLEHGIYLISDWAILNDTSPKQLERIYTEFHQTAQYSIQQAKNLLEAYHAIYRADRLRSKLSGTKGQCPPPTSEQLQKISTYLATNFAENLDPNSILYQLQEIANKLRQYRIQARGGKSRQVSLDQPNLTINPEKLLDRTDDEQEPFAFLAAYRQQFEQSLENAIAKVTDIRHSKLKQRSPHSANNFLTGLSLFHCHGQPMAEIATAVGLEAQYQVTRLLKLKELRSDVRREMLGGLKEQVIELAKFYTLPSQLSELDRKLEVVLQELVEEEMERAEAESIKSKGIPLRSRFAIKLCKYLQRVHKC
ncbi:hypothetical protein H6F42_20625 [Pseudanabaena sp. FACHB-1998]|uniref:hypothetical protein n=1 Tax=Pseudanabaena sp. FACHB-1998 TaxID=2692858 RepID=UPI0016814FEE|nr:hypothetical protein [Pseudanabaena sp. FACHB-1998]MBD2179333.1 hypothetical protein [Pseudanabaena sp. FACHB-1998]